MGDVESLSSTLWPAVRARSRIPRHSLASPGGGRPSIVNLRYGRGGADGRGAAGARPFFLPTAAYDARATKRR